MPSSALQVSSRHVLQMWKLSADKARELGSWLWEDEASLRLAAHAWSHPQMREYIKLIKTL